MAARGVEAGVGDIPWPQVGGGWMLAMWSPVEGSRGELLPDGRPPQENSATSLYLVNPQGGRYLITTLAAPADGVSPQLVDWSGDGDRALFYSEADRLGTVTEVDLHTGEHRSFTVKDGFGATPRYTRPEGKAVILSRSPTVDDSAMLDRVSRDGAHQLSYPLDRLGGEFTGEYLSAPDGTHLVVGTEAGLAIVGNDGAVGAVLPIEGVSRCTPERWWDATTVVTSCFAADHSGSRLWLVDVDGGEPTALTALIDGVNGAVLGAGAAWDTPAGIFVQGYGSCGLALLARLDAFGALPTEVTVPEVDEDSSVVVVGTHDGHLDLKASVACGTGQSLLDYDPAARTSTVLLGGDVNGGGVIKALAYPGFE